MTQAQTQRPRGGSRGPEALQGVHRGGSREVKPWGDGWIQPEREDPLRPRDLHRGGVRKGLRGFQWPHMEIVSIKNRLQWIISGKQLVSRSSIMTSSSFCRKTH